METKGKRRGRRVGKGQGNGFVVPGGTADGCRPGYGRFNLTGLSATLRSVSGADGI